MGKINHEEYKEYLNIALELLLCNFEWMPIIKRN
jgi:hypothetical protein